MSINFNYSKKHKITKRPQIYKINGETCNFIGRKVLFLQDFLLQFISENTVNKRKIPFKIILPNRSFKMKPYV